MNGKRIKKEGLRSRTNQSWSSKGAGGKRSTRSRTSSRMSLVRAGSKGSTGKLFKNPHQEARQDPLGPEEGVQEEQGAREAPGAGQVQKGVWEEQGTREAPGSSSKTLTRSRTSIRSRSRGAEVSLMFNFFVFFKSFIRQIFSRTHNCSL